MARETRRPNIQNKEIWTVLAVVRGEGVGLLRGTKIRVKVDEKGLQLVPLSLHDWLDNPILERVTPHSEGDEPGPFDPQWHWAGRVERQGTGAHDIRLGLVSGDPGVLALYVNQKGIAVILR